jgi:glutaminyl-peptide cyclotransferase
VETGEVLRLHALPEDLFGEGLARVGDRLIQITWREGVALVYDLETFEVVDTFRYEGNGWGLCHDGASLWMTTGGSMLVERDPATFEVRRRVPVTLGDRPLYEVNELACVGEHIYGNVFQSDRIVRIDKATGDVVAEIDATPLNPQSGRPVGDPEAVLNGIAWDPDTDTFYLTGQALADPLPGPLRPEVSRRAHPGRGSRSRRAADSAESTQPRRSAGSSHPRAGSSWYERFERHPSRPVGT